MPDISSGDINFSLYEGEIVGFAGLMGAGRTETTRAIFGVDPKDQRGDLAGRKRSENHLSDGRDQSRDRTGAGGPEKDGLCTKLSIRHNLALPNLDLICSKLGVISSKKEDDLCEKAVKDLLIKTPTVEVNAGNLSGGNPAESGCWKVAGEKFQSRDLR